MHGLRNEGGGAAVCVSAGPQRQARKKMTARERRQLKKQRQQEQQEQQDEGDDAAVCSGVEDTEDGGDLDSDLALQKQAVSEGGRKGDAAQQKQQQAAGAHML